MIKSKKIVSVILSFFAAICLACGLMTIKSSGVHAETATVLTDKEAFVSEIKANPNGNFELGADIDFGGETIGQIESFGGTLDGKGYALKNVAVNTYYIKNATNTATIKNIKVEWTLAVAGEDYTGFIQVNAGLIDNVYFAATLQAYSWHTAPLAGANSGTIQNAVVTINKTDDFTELSRIGGIIGCDYNGKLTNCYTVHNGILAGAENRFYLDDWGNDGKTNCAIYATMAELAAAISFDSANGWNTEIWTVENGEVKMSHPVTPASPTVLTQADVENFKTLLNGSTGSFVLGEDLDFANAQTAGVINFKGTLDGNGYSLKNLLVHFDARDDGWSSYLFAENSGTIKNLGVYYTLKTNSTNDSFISVNKGTVSNVFVSVSATGNDGWTLGAIINTNDGGTVENCITVINEDSTGTANFGSIVAVDKLGTIKNCYSVTNGKISSDKPYAAEVGQGHYQNNANYATMAELAAAINFEEANGWNVEIWENTGSAIIFGNKVPVEMEILGASIRYATESDSEAGIRFGVRLNMAAYNRYAEIEDTEMGMIVVPESKSNGVSIINLKTPNVKKIVTFGAEGNKWGYYKENGVKVEGYVQSVVYVWGIPAANYNDDIKVAAYIKEGDNVIYSETFSMCINEVALRALETETDETKRAQLNAYINANEYTVEFKDGDTVMQTANYHYGDTVTEPNTNKAGYTFIGWDKEFAAKVTRSVTYTAIYEEKITVLTQADVANFASILSENLSGKYVLGSDIDFGGAELDGIGTFSGTLDGKGYFIKNFGLKYNANTSTQWSYAFIANNAGTIKNIGIEYSLKGNNGHEAVIYENSGIIENVYVKVNMITKGWANAALVGINQDTGTVRNVVAVLTKEASVSTGGLGSVIGAERNGKVRNAYAVCGDVILSTEEAFKTPYFETFEYGTYENNANYTTMAELAAAITFNSENGWNTEYTDRLFAEVVAIQNAGNEIAALAVLSRGAASCEDDRVADFAAEDLKYYFNLITGKNLNVKTISSLSELEAGVKYFVLGKELAQEAALSFEGLTTETGYIVQKTENGIYLYGNTAYGTLNAVYAMLNQAFGLEIYTDEVYTADRDSFEYSRVADRTVFNPSIDKMWAQNGALNANSDFTYQRRLGYVNSWQEVNGTYHNFLEVIKKSVYGAEHPEWFVTVTATDSKQPFETLCLTAGGEDMAAIVAKYARDEILAQDATGNVKDIFVFGQPDARGWCDCSASAAVKNNYGANSAEYIIFMNKVAKIFEDNYSAEIGRKITFMLMAYNAALEAPAKNLSELKLYDTDKAAVAAMVAMIEGNSYRELKDDVLSKKYGHSNRYFLDQFNVWKSLGKAYFWRYSAYFDNYFVPIDTISNMQATYKAIAESGAEVLVDQGVSGIEGATDFDALKIYLKAKLAKDVNADVETLIKNFCNAYYGAGGEKMYEFLTIYRAWYKTLDGKTTSSNKDSLGCHMIGGMDIFNKKYWDDTPSGTIFKSYDASMLKGWYANYIEAALNLVEADSDYAKRIKTEGLFVRYMAYAVYGDSTYGDFAAIATDAKALGIEKFAEGNAYVKSGSYVDGSIDNLQ